MQRRTIERRKFERVEERAKAMEKESAVVYYILLRQKLKVKSPVDYQGGS